MQRIAVLFFLLFSIQLMAQPSLHFDRSEVVDGRIYRTIDFDRPLLAKDHTLIAMRDIQLLGYLGNGSYFASIPADRQLSKDLVSLGITRAERLDFASKLDVSLDDIPAYARDGQKVLIEVQYPKDLDYHKVLARVERDGYSVVAAHPASPFMTLAVAYRDLASVSQAPYLIAAEIAGPPGEKEDLRARVLHRVNKLGSIYDPNIGLSGRGVNLLVRDDGAIFNHIDFAGRLNQDFVGPSGGDHGDGVAGIMAGAGNLNPDYTGMAYGANLWVQDYRGDFLGGLMNLVNANNIKVTNSSYSDGCNRGYTIRSRTVDQQVYDNPTLMHVFSAGNEGTEDCGYGAGPRWGNITGGHKIGKNVIAVANLDPFGRVVNSSSRGPSQDGRLKPDISANGFDHVSTAEEHGYMVFGGTSAAAPAVAGIMALLHEAYQNQYGDEASSALLKALMLNTADDAGRPGPDFEYGWGVANAYKAVKALREERYAEVSVEAGQVLNIPIDVPDNTYAVKVMTYWPDPEAFNDNQVLINDINSSLVIDSAVYNPLVLDYTPDPSRLAAPARPGIDSVNNVEQIVVLDPPAGTHSIGVFGHRIPMGVTECIVTWEFISNDIEITYPFGGEHIIAGETALVAWDAGGNEESFRVELVQDDGTTRLLGTRSGATRMLPWNPGQDFSANNRIRITRGNQTVVSDSSFTIADRAENLRLTNQADSLIWTPVPGAIGYRVHALLDKYMEVIDTSTQPLYILPQDGSLDGEWMSVSPIFLGETAGRRSQAIVIKRPLVAAYTNDADDEPCIDQPTTFVGEEQAPGTEYRWDFGSKANPEEAFGRGPHTITYDRSGRATGLYYVSDDFDEVVSVLRVNVLDLPQIQEIILSQVDPQTFDFSAEVEDVTAYFWDFGDGTTSEDPAPRHIYEENGTYDVILTASSKCGDVQESVEVEVIMVNTAEVKWLEQVNVSPNPSPGHFTVSIPTAREGVQLTLYNQLGQVVAQKTTDGNAVSFDVEESGHYVLNITDGHTHKRLPVQVIR